jgi:hypothetical protein
MGITSFGGDYVIFEGNNITNGVAILNDLEKNRTYLITAIPLSGYMFDRWIYGNDVTIGNETLSTTTISVSESGEVISPTYVVEI